MEITRLSTIELDRRSTTAVSDSTTWWTPRRCFFGCFQIFGATGSFRELAKGGRSRRLVAGQGDVPSRFQCEPQADLARCLSPLPASARGQTAGPRSRDGPPRPLRRVDALWP